MATFTSMKFALSATLQSHLSGKSNGVYVYAFAFNGSGNLLGSTTLISNGTVQPTASFTLPLTSATTPQVQGGNVVVVTQQTGPNGKSTLLADVKAIGNVLDPAAATKYNFRYDAIEYTLTNQGSDVADLTNITQFGSPISLSVNYGDGTTATRGYAVSGAAIVAGLKALSPANTQNFPFKPATPLNEQRETMTPGSNLVPNPLNRASDWKSYVTGFETLAKNGEVYIASYFNGVNGGASASLSYYQVKYASNVFWLVPVDIKGVATTNYAIRIPFSTLTQNIYTQTGTSLDVYTKMNGKLVASYKSFTPNNAYGDVVKYFVAGFDAGFWGGGARSINPKAAFKVDLNQTWNWTADYAYEAINAPSSAKHFGYTNSIGTGTGKVGDPNRKMYYDPFAAYFVHNSNAYGYSYSDLLSSGGGVNPSLPIYDPKTRADVSSIGVKLFDLNEKPTGYTPPAFNYVPPAGSTYSPANKVSTDQFLFDFSVATYGPAKGTPLQFRFYAPGDSQAGSDGFVTLKLPQTYTQVYTFGKSNGKWVLTPNGASGAAGFFIINGAPVTSNGSTGWYQMVIGSGSSTKTYNIYVKATQNAVTSAVVDGGAEAQLITGQANQVKFSFAPAGSITYDPAWLAAGGSLMAPTLPAPLVGDVASNGAFDPFLALADLEQGELAFSSTPADDGDELVGGNFARISFTNRDHPGWIIAPVVTQSNIDGDWVTGLSAQFGNGRYSAVMEQYKLSDEMLESPVGAATKPVDFTVNLDKLELVAADGGAALGLDAAGSTTEGNWIQLNVLHSSLANGTLLAYATDAAGNLVDRDGRTGAGVTLDDAVLGRFGWVESDGGGTLFAGNQSIYLPVGQELHFAIESGNGVIDRTPAVNVTGSRALAVSVAGANGSLDFTAKIDNTLLADETLAGSQRLTDEAWVYLTQGATVHVDTAGSAWNVNTIHFVRIDVDQTTGDWSVGGVDYGNTAAFRAAVQAAWDPNFHAAGGRGDFHQSFDWTVAQGSGFYAPVLATEGGDIFVIGRANVDGLVHIRSYGASTFGFEDLRADQRSDFDYNDMVMKLTVPSTS